MRDWLTQGLLASAQDIPEELEGYVLGRGLPAALAEEMRVGLWRPRDVPSPDPVFNKRNGEYGQYRQDWMTIPMWSPRGHLVGVEFRTWEGEKEVRDFRLPESKWIPAFIGLTPSALQKVWDGGDVWLVEGVFDIALAHAVPAKDVVLACGTARVSRLQMAFLHRFLAPSAMVHVAFDMDETGQRQITGFTDESTGRWIPGVPDRMDRVGIRNRAVRYRGGKDPGQIWEEGGRDALRTAFHL
jgi:DNA primase